MSKYYKDKQHRTRKRYLDMVEFIEYYGLELDNAWEADNE